MSSEGSSPRWARLSEDEELTSKVVTVIDEGIVKSCVKDAVIPDVNFEVFFTRVWKQHEELTALVDTRSRTTFTFGELLDASRRVATGLRKLGLDTGDVVAFHGANSCELVVAMCGTFFAGGIGMLNKSSLTVGEVYRQLVDAKAKYVFCELDKIAEMRQTCSRIDSVEAIIVTDGTCEGANSVSQLKQTDTGENEILMNPSPEMTLCIIYSTGTTGLPKGVQVTHRNLIAQVVSYGCLQPVYEKGDALLCAPSIMHVGAFWALFCYLGLGSKVVLLDRHDVGAMLSAVEEHKVTTMGAYPAVIRQLDQWHKLEDFDTRSLTKILCGGGAVNPSILQSVRRKLNLKELSQALSECLAFTRYQVHGEPAMDIPRKVSSAELIDVVLQEASMRSQALVQSGSVNVNLRLRILSELVLEPIRRGSLKQETLSEKVVDFHTRKLLGPNQQGEVCVKGPAAFKAYLNQPKATAETYEDGFFCTGDMGYYTEDGCIFLCGRFKELIKCMDQQVSPAELEELLASDPDVRHVVVAGVPHPKYGEAARAFVVHWRSLTDPLERQQEADRLKRVTAGRLSHHKQLHGGVEFLDSIPLSEAGKDLRSALTKTYVERLQNAKENRVE